ncbi:hypothetical protein UFOVP964_24 [uncultured Caudovirales phage]|uniref:Uncharacterized protein n=1 Tax=uncultured Caudovirales phage TaxID=2100421 RepID=A0A6J5RH95_9CAUD|nr:hypothetical protein UFOVP854_24 [uncultured Caudovirales phage]CAB4174064.1 hypothetical protein UFOVP964_24 [uncultured Caudovirales phage]CAB4179520.1 hypothetical protein UFOVP1034_134 [uncultured Caudovirales phage]CAB4189178.1 hypothetical protein UFOVP1177_134 [uncultured Caudovirales phage]CAB4193647.1 hypothetical protein UFOVP1243_121 [uncultured Caudovirales phage]
MTFLLSEDEALRNLLKDMVVTDQKSVTEAGPQRKVGVWFGQPDQEIRGQSYPYITIDMIDIAEDFQRAMRGRANPWYMQDPTNMVDGVQAAQGVQGIDAVPYDPTIHGWDISYPIPVNIDYQITTYARQPRHDREILAQLLYTKIPFRFAILEPDDHTVRRLDVLDISKRDVTEQGKRLFVNAITVRVSSEIAPETYNQMYKALQVIATGPDTPQSQVIGRGQFTPVSFTIQAP